MKVLHPIYKLRWIRETWRMGVALRWVSCNNAEIRLGRRSNGFTTFYGWEVVSRGHVYYSGELLAAIEYARDMRHNPRFIDFRVVNVPRGERNG